MNRALPPGDRGYRSSASRWASGSARAVPGAGRLVGGAAAADWRPDEKKPPRGCPGGGRKPDWKRSGLDRVGALAVLATWSIQPPGPSSCPGSTGSRGPNAPASRLLSSAPSGWLHPAVSAGPGRLRFAALAGALSLRLRGFLGRLGALLGRGGLLPRLGLCRRNVGAPWRNTGLLGGFRLVAGVLAWAVSFSSVIVVFISRSPLAVITASTT